MIDCRITLTHVGARGHGLPKALMQIADAFASDVSVALYEANTSCVDDTREWWNANSRCAVTVFPYCLWSTDGEVDFRFNRRPATNSVYPLNPRFARYSHPLKNGGYQPLGEATETVEVQRMRTHSLDTLVASGEVPPPDFLGLDTQGSEFEILSGATDSLARRTVAVLTEVAFDEVYEGQRTFPDVHRTMLGLGFALAALSTRAAASFQAPIGARARGEPLFADALYFRRPETLPTEERPIGTVKVAAIAASLGHVEFALGALATADTPHASLQEAHRCGYVQFLDKVQSASAAGERNDESSPLENVFDDYGFVRVAGELRKRRLSDQGFGSTASPSSSARSAAATSSG